MPKLKLLTSSLLCTTIATLVATKVQANCADSIASLELVQPVIERYFQQLQQKSQFPWGKVQPYGKLSGDRITLTPQFDSLTGTQKKQVLDLLRLDYNSNWFSLLSEQEQAMALKDPGIGALSPYLVFASDDRVISYPYDGCTRLTLLTEFYRHQTEVGYSRSLPDRVIRFPLSLSQEKAVKTTFWRTVGYKQQDIQWIAWVPERGYFEINVYKDAANLYQRRLNKFWRVALRKYRYVVLDQNGNLLLNRK